MKSAEKVNIFENMLFLRQLPDTSNLTVIKFKSIAIKLAIFVSLGKSYAKKIRRKLFSNISSHLANSKPLTQLQR